MPQNNQKTKADEMAELQQRIFEREVDEELRQERLANFWKKYKFVIIGGVICIILSTIAHEWYGSWQQKIRQAESDQLEEALIASVKGNEAEALTQLKHLGKVGKTGYRYIAQLEEIGLLFKQGNREQALSMLEAFSHDEKAPRSLRDVAVISYVGHQLDNGDVAQLKKMITPLTQGSSTAFYGQAIELLVRLHLRSGDKTTAKALINEAIASDKTSPTVKERLTLLAE
ncbi:MAG: tetratricopeptide repeat protein [Pseudomonadota bacterium]|nr:tetratricopeptide repeat protein [Pseudomonadota bacterium]